MQRVTKNGYRDEVVPVSAEAVTADLDERRIRLFLDEHDMVARAAAGYCDNDHFSCRGPVHASAVE